MEADLAFRGVDLRDFWLPGGGPSRLSLRRLLLLVKALPHDATFRRAVVAAAESEQTARLSRRRAHYAEQKARQEQEASGDR